MQKTLTSLSEDNEKNCKCPDEDSSSVVDIGEHNIPYVNVYTGCFNANPALNLCVQFKKIYLLCPTDLWVNMTEAIYFSISTHQKLCDPQ